MAAGRRGFSLPVGGASPCLMEQGSTLVTKISAIVVTIPESKELLPWPPRGLSAGQCMLSTKQVVQIEPGKTVQRREGWERFLKELSLPLDLKDNLDGQSDVGYQALLGQNL